MKGITMQSIIKIIEYQEKYKNEIIEHIRTIAMDEFEYNDWQDYFNRMTFEEYKNEGSKFWIALNEKEEVVGTIGGLKVSNKEVKMCSLYVKQNYRKQGIAKELYQLLIDFAKQQGYQKITLRTFFKFVNAINFYEKIGFEKYNQDEESYFYRKML